MSQKAEVVYNPDVLSPPEIAALIDDIGFAAEVLDAAEHKLKDGVIELHVSVQGPCIITARCGCKMWMWINVCIHYPTKWCIEKCAHCFNSDPE